MMKGDCSQENSEDIKLITHIEKNTRQLSMQVLCTYQCMSCTLRELMITTLSINYPWKAFITYNIINYCNICFF